MFFARVGAPLKRHDVGFLLVLLVGMVFSYWVLANVLLTFSRQGRYTCGDFSSDLWGGCHSDWTSITWQVLTILTGIFGFLVGAFLLSLPAQTTEPWLPLVFVGGYRGSRMDAPWGFRKSRTCTLRALRSDVGCTYVAEFDRVIDFRTGAVGGRGCVRPADSTSFSPFSRWESLASHGSHGRVPHGAVALAHQTDLLWPRVTGRILNGLSPSPFGVGMATVFLLGFEVVVWTKLLLACFGLVFLSGCARAQEPSWSNAL
ncbi:MAG: hypothetical protein Ct9H300mP8_09380 [Gammaproteobacteria bacterium]|nr:MAG: hypothetical protein Ct9H300mP8_09380 [Gammaproteobacteria bacterium]